MAALGAWRRTTEGLLLVLAGGCGADVVRDFGPPPPTLTRQDVENLPAGNSTATFNAFYASSQERLIACHCRVGSCGLIHTRVGEGVTVDQQSGVLRMLFGFPSDLELTGGVNQDGTFLVGGFQEVLPPSIAGYVRVTGTFMPAGGIPTTILMSSDRTASAINGTVDDLDCDTTMTGQFDLQNP